jgi:hypothetical protein
MGLEGYPWDRTGAGRYKQPNTRIKAQEKKEKGPLIESSSFYGISEIDSGIILFFP